MPASAPSAPTPARVEPPSVIAAAIPWEGRLYGRSEIVSNDATKRPARGFVRGWILLGICLGDKWQGPAFAPLDGCYDEIPEEAPIVVSLKDMYVKTEARGPLAFGSVKRGTAARLVAYEPYVLAPPRKLSVSGTELPASVAWYGQVELRREDVRPLRKPPTI